MERQESQSRYRALVEPTLVGVCIVQDGSIVYANPKMAEISGYTLEEQSALPFFLDLVADADRQVMSQRLDNIGQLASGVAHSFNNALTAIYGRCEVLLDQISTEDLRREWVGTSSLTAVPDTGPRRRSICPG